MTVQVVQGRVILPDRVLDHGRVVIEDGVIQAVTDDGSRFAPTDDVGDHFVAPGLVDVHTHGIAGADTMDASREALLTMARRYAAHGVTGFLPTTMTHSMHTTRQAIRQVSAYISQPEGQDPAAAQVLGIHLEGPWISVRYKGAQNGQYISLPDEEAVAALLAEGQGTVKIVSLAPELPGADQAIRMLRRHGVCVSIGHTGASYDEALRAMDAGATQITHCFNAMPPLHHRHPGVIGAGLSRGDVYAELIADGVHVHPAVMRVLVQVKGRERVMLVSDSMSATELPDGVYALGEQNVYVRDGGARLSDGTLAGSTLTLDRAVRNMIHLCGIAVHDAVYMASAAPAEAIGLGHHKGKICPGYDADLVILDADMRPLRVMIGGQMGDMHD